MLKEFTVDVAREIVKRRLPSDIAINRAFIDGDHYQNGKGWIGPRPSIGSNGESVWTEIKATFISKNVIRECWERHKKAVIGREPDWKFTAKPSEPMPRLLKRIGNMIRSIMRKLLDQPDDPLIVAAESALVDWWDRKGIHQVLQEAVGYALEGQRACLRLYVPVGLTEDPGDEEDTTSDRVRTVPLGTLHESLDRIFLQVLKPEWGAVEPDEETLSPVGVYAYAETVEADGASQSTPVQRRDVAEFHYIDQTENGPRAIIRTVTSNDAVVDEIFEFDLNGHIAMFELRLPPFITEQVRSANKLLNLALTMLARNVVLGGFLERILLNAVMPTEDIPDPQNPDKTITVLSQYKLGAGTTASFSGLPIYGDPSDPERVTGHTPASVVYRDPVPTETFENTIDIANRAILDETRQRHVEIARDAVASGESRKQATGDFLASLDDTVAAVNEMGRWVLETALAMASNFAGEPDAHHELRAVFECRLNAGPISTQEIQDAVLLNEKGVIAMETTRQRVGVVDTDAEQNKIDGEVKRAAEAAKKAVPAPAIDPKPEDNALPAAA